MRKQRAAGDESGEGESGGQERNQKVKGPPGPAAEGWQTGGGKRESGSTTALTPPETMRPQVGATAPALHAGPHGEGSYTRAPTAPWV